MRLARRIDEVFNGLYIHMDEEGGLGPTDGVARDILIENSDWDRCILAKQMIPLDDLLSSIDF